MDTEEITAQVAENTAVVEQAREPAPRDYEAEARQDGWKPEAEFKPGEHRPSVFIDAETFVKKGEEITSITRKKNEALKKRIDELEKNVDARVTKLVNVQRANYDREVANYEREITRLKAEQVKAVEAGDVPGFKRLDKEIGDMPVPEEVEADTAQVAPDAVPDKDAIVQKFKEANTWYETDDAMTAYAEGYSQKLAADSGDKMPLDKNLKLVEKRMRELFPNAYKAAAKTNGHASVDGGGDFNGVGGNPLFKLPNEARAQCKADMERYPKIYKSAADWIKVYEKK